jgi:hypothetical protein
VRTWFDVNILTHTHAHILQILSKLDQPLKLLTYILDVFSSNLGWDGENPNGRFRDFP